MYMNERATYQPRITGNISSTTIITCRIAIPDQDYQIATVNNPMISSKISIFRTVLQQKLMYLLILMES